MLDAIVDWFLDLHPTIAAALVAAMVATPFRAIADWALQRSKVKTEYRQDQRKALRELVGRHIGGVVEKADSMNHRMWNLYKGPQNEAYLSVQGKYSVDTYYINSFVYRFLSLMLAIREVETQALLLDRRIALRSDYLFLDLVRAIRWSMTDVVLFGSLNYNPNSARDHFFGDLLSESADAFQTEKGTLSLRQVAQASGERPVERIYEFFDGLNSKEDRLRWDRLVVFDLILMTFLNAFGYTVHRTSERDLRQAALRVRHSEVLRSLIVWLPKLQLHPRIAVRRPYRSLRRLRRVAKHAERRRRKDKPTYA